MEKKTIQASLQDELEKEIPSADVHLWQAVKANLVAGKTFQQGEKMKPIDSRRIPRAAFAGLILVALLSLAFVTPQGRALAQSVLQSFTRAESDTFYMEPSDVTVEESTPFLAECGSWIHPTCSMEQIRSKVDFEVKELGILPEKMYYAGATGGPENIGFAYVYKDRDRLGGQLSVSVEPTHSASALPWLVAQSANVEQVQIGDLPGEYYTGILFQDEHGNVTWQPNDPTATLRWVDGGSKYTLSYYSRRYPLTKEELISLAESMTLEPVK